MNASSLHISSTFDSGAVEVLSLADHADIRLRIRPDTASPFTQWFHFRLEGARGLPCRLSFDNAGECAYPEGWRDYGVVASYCGQQWFRIPSRYDGKTLSWTVTPEHDSLFFAYFEPYPESRHLAFMGEAQRHPAVRLETVGRSLLGRSLDLLRIGTPGAGKKNLWIIARQHPGEPMAEWFVEGLLRRLLGLGEHQGDPVGGKLLEHAVLHVVPNMNPDGSALGNLRTNAAGANLNREWLEPDEQRSPEVLAVRRAIAATGCDLFLDIHGDEALPYVFVDGCNGLPNFGEREEAEQQAFLQRFLRASPDFQTQYGYPRGHFGSETLKLATKYVGHTHGCLALTLELPFKDNANDPRPDVGWNGARSAALGAAMVSALHWQLADL